jgi:hypothetical protein
MSMPEIMSRDLRRQDARARLREMVQEGLASGVIDRIVANLPKE